jgi:dienelactone hydrolase
MPRDYSIFCRSIVLGAAAILSAIGHSQTEQLLAPNSSFSPGAKLPFSAPPAYAQPQGGTLVSFKSPQEGAPEFAVKGVLFKPGGVAKGTPKGAVVIVNSADGWSDAREGQYARSISSAGYAVLAIDTYGPRGVTQASTDNTTITTYEQARDAFAAKRYLVSVGYPADRIAVMGAGRGGTIALLAADRTFLGREEGDRFAVAIAVGAACFLHPRQPKPSANVFIAIGDKDQVTGVKPCQDLAHEYAAVGGKSTVKVYPGATNGFDGDPVNRTMFRYSRIETFVDCNVVVEPDGSAVYEGKRFAETNSSALFVEMRKSCIKIGASGYTNVTQKANVTLDLIDFLDANLLR